MKKAFCSTWKTENKKKGTGYNSHFTAKSETKDEIERKEEEIKQAKSLL